MKSDEDIPQFEFVMCPVCEYEAFFDGEWHCDKCIKSSSLEKYNAFMNEYFKH